MKTWIIKKLGGYTETDLREAKSIVRRAWKARYSSLVSHCLAEKHSDEFREAMCYYMSITFDVVSNCGQRVRVGVLWAPPYTFSTAELTRTGEKFTEAAICHDRDEYSYDVGMHLAIDRVFTVLLVGCTSLVLAPDEAREVRWRIHETAQGRLDRRLGRNKKKGQNG